MTPRYLKNIGFMGATELILQLKGLVIMPILTAHLGTVNYGAWAQVTLLVTFAPVLIMLGTANGISRYLPGKNLEEQKRWFFGWVGFGIVSGFIVCTLIYFFRQSMSAFLFGIDQDYVHYIPLAVGMIFVSVLLSMVRSWFRLHHDGFVFSLIAISQALWGILVVIAIKLLDQGLFELVFYTLMGEIFIVATLYVLIYRRYGFSWPDLSFLKPCLSYGLPLLPLGLFAWIINYIDRIFLMHFGGSENGLEQVGVYSVGCTIASMIILSLARPIYFMFPSYSTELYNQDKSKDYETLIQNLSTLAVVLLLPACAGLALTSKEILTFLATPEFMSAYYVIPIIAFGHLFNSLKNYFVSPIFMKNKRLFLFGSLCIAAGLNVGLNAFLIPLYGITGAAVATACSYFLDAVIILCLSTFLLKQIVIRVRPYFSALFATLVMVAVLYLLFTFPVLNSLPVLTILFLKVAIGAGLYLLVFYILENTMLWDMLTQYRSAQKEQK